MFVSGFTFCRNLIRLDYPFIESMQSMLPIVDELVVAVGDSDDGTLEAVEALRSRNPKIRIVKTVWDPALFDNGKIFSDQTNLALSHVNPKADWALHLQADEFLHENDHERIRASMERYKADQGILGLMFRQLYFYGDYWHTNPYAGRRLLRIIRADGTIESIGDSSGFARKSDGVYIGKEQKNLWRYADGWLYHYGFVNLPKKLQEKIKAKSDLYHMGVPIEEDERKISDKEYQPENMGIMKPFTGTHPKVLEERVENFPLRYSLPNRWFNPEFYRYVLRHGFKG
jgi:glycosyltransferase involved in cell wall biosynthesis